MNNQRIPATLDDFAVPPGETLREVLDELGMSQADLARRTDLTAKHVNQVMQGLAPVSADVALKLERVTGLPAYLWLRLEADYRSTLTRREQREALAPDVAWAKTMPVAALVKLGQLAEAPSDWISRVEQLLRFFGVATVEAYRGLLAQQAVAFRQSVAFAIDENAVATWLRLGELAARTIDQSAFNAEQFRQVVSSVKQLTTRSLRDALPELIESCAHAGVAVVLVPEIPGARAYGSTRWVSSRKPVIQLSTRGKTVDAFWLSFAHEAGHVLLHERRSTFVESRLTDEEVALASEEVEADEFAFHSFIPESVAGKISDLQHIPDVVSFAADLGIDPGIVVARLHRTGVWTHQQGATLRRKLRDSDIPGASTLSIQAVRPERLNWSLPGAGDE